MTGLIKPIVILPDVEIFGKSLLKDAILDAFNDAAWTADLYNVDDSDRGGDCWR
jgi:hypothetical protein